MSLFRSGCRGSLLTLVRRGRGGIAVYRPHMNDGRPALPSDYDTLDDVRAHESPKWISAWSKERSVKSAVVVYEVILRWLWVRP